MRRREHRLAHLGRIVAGHQQVQVDQLRRVQVAGRHGVQRGQHGRGVGPRRRGRHHPQFVGARGEEHGRHGTGSRRSRRSPAASGLVNRAGAGHNSGDLGSRLAHSTPRRMMSPRVRPRRRSPPRRRRSGTRREQLPAVRRFALATLVPCTDPHAPPASAPCPAPTPARPTAWSSTNFPTCPSCRSCPARGVGADMIGRGTALLVEFYAEVQPSGWRLTDRPGRDARRAELLPAAGPGLPGGERAGVHRDAEDAGRRALDPGLHPGAAARRPDARPTSAPCATSPSRSPRACAAPRRRAQARAPGRHAHAPARRARAARRPEGHRAHRQRLRPAARRRRPAARETLAGADSRPCRRRRRRGRRPLLRPRHPYRPAARRPAPTTSPSTRPARRHRPPSPARDEQLGEAIEAGVGLMLGVVPSTDPARVPASTSSWTRSCP